MSTSSYTQVVVTGARGVHAAAGDEGNTFTFHSDFLHSQEAADEQARKLFKIVCADNPMHETI